MCPCSWFGSSKAYFSFLGGEKRGIGWWTKMMSGQDRGARKDQIMEFRCTPKVFSHASNSLMQLCLMLMQACGHVHIYIVLLIRHNVINHDLHISLICKYANMITSSKDEAQLKLMRMSFCLQLLIIINQMCEYFVIIECCKVIGCWSNFSLIDWVLASCWLCCLLEPIIYCSSSSPPQCQLLTAALQPDSCWLRICGTPAHFWSQASQIKPKPWLWIKQAFDGLSVVLL